jgi:hypothetical protein
VIRPRIVSRAAAAISSVVARSVLQVHALPVSEQGTHVGDVVLGLAQAELSPGASGVEAVVAGARLLLSEEGGADPA